jgi:hypothetical protein
MLRLKRSSTRKKKNLGRACCAASTAAGSKLATCTRAQRQYLCFCTSKSSELSAK